MLCIQHRLSCKTILRSNVLIRHFRSRALQKPQVSGASLTVRNLFSLCGASLARACIILAHFLPHRCSHISHSFSMPPKAGSSRASRSQQSSRCSSRGSLRAPSYSPFTLPSRTSSASTLRSTPRLETPEGVHVFSKYAPDSPSFRPVIVQVPAVGTSDEEGSLSRTPSLELPSRSASRLSRVSSSSSFIVSSAVPSRTSSRSSVAPVLLSAACELRRTVSKDVHSGPMPLTRRKPASVANSRGGSQGVSRTSSSSSLSAANAEVAAQLSMAVSALTPFSE